MNETPHPAPPKGPLIGLFVMVVLVLVASGYWYNHREVAQIKNEKYDYLQAISQLKVDQISAWLSERRKDADTTSSGIIRQDALAWLQSSSDAAIEHGLKTDLEMFKEKKGYENMMVASTDGQLLITLDPSLEDLGPSAMTLARKVSASREIQFGAIFRCSHCQDIYLDVAAPIFDGNREPVAVLFLRSNLEPYFYPLIQSWPTPSKSAETLLLRKDGEEILFLNELRHLKDTALKLRIPMSRTDVPAVQAALGYTGTFEGKDYRDVAVLSDIRPIPDTPWFMIAKVDSSEIFAEARYRTGVILFVVGLGILISGLIVTYIGSRQRSSIYKQLYASERRRREAQEEIKATLYGIGDGVLATDDKGHVTRMNPVAEHLTGWSEAEALGRPLEDVFRIVNEETRNEVENPVKRALREGQIVGLANHTLLIARDGVERPIADSAAPVVTEAGVIGVALVFRDQSEERAAQNALKERESFARSVLDAIGANIAVLDRKGVILVTNSAWRRFAIDNSDVQDEPSLGEGVNYLEVTEAATGMSSEGAAEALAGIRAVLDGSRQEFTFEYPCHSPSVQRWFMLRATPLLAGEGGAVLAHIDITYRTMLEMRRELAVQVLARLNRNHETVNVIGDILQLIKTHTGIEAIGIRLRNGEDFPYQESLGFPAEFIASQQPLCMHDEQGKTLCGANGMPLLECRCGDVLSGTFDPGKPFFTPYGSFWTNSTTEHLEETGDETRQTPLRLSCNQLGYESLALIPVRYGEEIIGLIHLTDQRKGMFTLEMIEFFEGIGASIGIALVHLRANEELRVNRERLEKAQEVGNVGCWEYDLQTGKIWASTEGFRIFGLAHESAGVPIERIEDCIEDRESVHNALLDLINRGDEYFQEYAIKPADGSASRFISSKAELARGEHGMPTKVIGVIQDITERKQAEEQIQAAHAETRHLLDEAESSRKVLLSLIEDQKRAEEEKEILQGQFLQSQKMESVGRLAGGVAHDFNNMLQVILGHTSVAMEQIDPGHGLFDHLNEIQHAAQRSSDLTRQLLAFARKQTIMPRVLDLNQTVSGMLKMLERLIGEDIELVWKPGLDINTVRMDPSQIDQILANLSVNARDAIAGHGNLTIETRNVAFDETYCASHAGFVPGEYVMLAVSDTGAGMDKKTIDKLFEPFFTTKELGKGTGLGLATVYGIVKQNNGFINVYSEPGRGTAIKIYLPCVKVEAVDPRLTETASPTRGTEMILVVEDEVPILNLAQEILQNYGYTVLAAATPAEALDLAERHKGLIDLLITDVVMPQMNGRDLKAMIANLQPGIKALYMSGYTANVIAHHGVIDEGVEFLQKPFSVRKLANKVREVLDGGSQQCKAPDSDTIDRGIDTNPPRGRNHSGPEEGGVTS